MWGVHCGHIIMENSWLGYVSSSLLKIPLKDTITWNHSKRITNKDSLISLSFSYEASSKVPLAEQLVEKYSIRALVSRNKKIIDFRKIKDSLIANTYFNFMLSSKNEPIYFLLTEGQFSTWKIRKGKYGMGWQVDRKFSLLKFVKFHCFERDNKLYILTNEGIMYRVDKRKLKKIKEIAFKNFNDQILIVDKDKNQVKLLDKNLMDSSEDLANTISTKSISLF
jgi:mRNA-degrading endonuclease RelE of RelBE toxin-antitoxin system